MISCNKSNQTELMMEGRGEHSNSDAKYESFACPDQMPENPRKKKKKNSKRFSDEQIRLLESIFKSETKLDPRKKMQLATDLGLQPRQIAIWFQNRRARWKSKQIEQQYNALRTHYDNLASRFESLKSEKQWLLSELQKLNEHLGLPKGLEGSNYAIDSQYGNTGREAETERGLENKAFTCSENEKDRLLETGQTGDETHRFVNWNQECTEGSLAPPDQRWYSFYSGGQFAMSGGSSSQWFNFWT